MTDLSLILGSSSPRRRELIARLGIEPARIAAAEIDETPQPQELPRPYAIRMAREKERAIRTAMHRRMGPQRVVDGVRIVVEAGRQLARIEVDVGLVHVCSVPAGRVEDKPG